MKSWQRMNFHTDPLVCHCIWMLNSLLGLTFFLVNRERVRYDVLLSCILLNICSTVKSTDINSTACPKYSTHNFHPFSYLTHAHLFSCWRKLLFLFFSFFSPSHIILCLKERYWEGKSIYGGYVRELCSGKILGDIRDPMDIIVHFYGIISLHIQYCEKIWNKNLIKTFSESKKFSRLIKFIRTDQGIDIWSLSKIFQKNYLHNFEFLKKKIKI